MRSTIRRSAAIFSFIVLAGLVGAYSLASEADALGVTAAPITMNTSQFTVSEPVAAAGRVAQEELRKLAQQAMNDLITSGRHSDN